MDTPNSMRTARVSPQKFGLPNNRNNRANKTAWKRYLKPNRVNPTVANPAGCRPVAGCRPSGCRMQAAGCHPQGCQLPFARLPVVARPSAGCRPPVAGCRPPGCWLLPNCRLPLDCPLPGCRPRGCCPVSPPALPAWFNFSNPHGITFSHAWFTLFFPACSFSPPTFLNHPLNAWYIPSLPSRVRPPTTKNKEANATPMISEPSKR